MDLETARAACSDPAPPLPARVLVVDDEDDVRNVLARILEEHGHAVACAETLDDATACLAIGGIDVVRSIAGLGAGPATVAVTGIADALVPVVVLTTSREEADVLRSYELHANSYIAKPIDLHECIDVVRSIEGYWLSIVRLPVRDGGAAVRG
jgi:DNA-binding response OmpR family regulator